MHMTADTAVYYKGISASDAQTIAACRTQAELFAWFAACSVARFAVFVYDKQSNHFYAFNDVFGYQEIFLIQKGNGLIISSTIPYRSTETYDHAALYELLSFQSVMAPQTVINGVEIVPLAQCAVVDLADSTYDYEQYWDMRDQFRPKAATYEQVTTDLRNAFYKTIVSEPSKKVSVALSGGIDSGCILGILHEKYKQDIPSVSFGPYGEKSNDLESSRKTAQHFGSTNVELYPKHHLFSDVLQISRSLTVPISGELLVSNIQLLQAAKATGANAMYFGYGTQMLLGNLGLNQLWDRLWLFELLAPKFLRRIIFRMYLRGADNNRRTILLADTWIERFVYKYAPLLRREQKLFKHLPKTFVSDMVQKMQPHTDDALLLSDQIVTWSFSSWMNYGQGRNAAALGRIIGVEAVLPYNTPATAMVLGKVTDKMRKKNKWNKQLWRDAVRPFIPDHLYDRKGKSLTIQYDKLLLPQSDVLIQYLEDSPLISEVIDCGELRRSLADLPEPGLLLLRLLSIAIWHDARIGSNRAASLQNVFKALPRV